MVGIRRFKLLIGIFIPFLCFFLMSQNTFAQEVQSFSSIQSICRDSSNGTWVTITNTNSSIIYGNNSGYNSCYRVNASLGLNTPISGTSFNSTATIKVSITANNAFDGGFYCENLRAGSYSIKPEQGTISSINSSLDSCVLTHKQPNYAIYTIKISSSGNLNSITSVSSFFLSMVGTQQAPILETISIPNDVIINYLGGDINFSVSSDPNTSVLGDINQNITNINNTIENHYNQEQQAYDNIANQSVPSGTDNQQSTNLIGVISEFIGQLTNFQATNCRIKLDFPSFVGGSRWVGICDGRTVLGNFLSIIGNLALIAFFIPLAYTLLKMIYNEIRSFTNG